MMPSNAALIVRYCCRSLTACACACAALMESSYERTNACAASTAFWAITTSFSATTPGVAAAAFSRSYVLRSPASLASASARCSSSACARARASATCEIISGASSVARICPCLTALPRSTLTAFTKPFTFAKIGTARYGWNSPGSFVCLSTTRADTVTTSTGVCAAMVAAANIHTRAIDAGCALRLGVMVSARRIVGMQRWRHRSHSPLDHRVDERQHRQRRQCGQKQSTNDGATEGPGLRAFAGADRDRDHADDHGRCGHQNRA